MVILSTMKTAISISDDIFTEAEITARQLGISRSKLYAQAISEFVKAHKPEAITAKLNKIYSEASMPLDNDIIQSNYDLVSKDEW
jgi:predicted transcriptional regulator